MIRSRALHLLTVIPLFFVAAKAGAPPKPSDAELAAISARGILLAECDSAAWQATDAVKAVHPIEGRVGRYIAHKTEAQWVVDFGRLSETGNSFLVAYEAIQTGNPTRFEVRSLDPVREEAGWNLAAARGIDSALRDFGGAGRPYNVAVLPGDRESMYVYVYPAQVRTGVYPIGADVRYRTSLDGTTILEKRQMHKAVIESVPGSLKGTATFGYHTHVLSDLPEDTDVLLVLTRKPRMPEVVIAGAYMFTIDVNGKITYTNCPR
jgi:hypothetical protein